MPRRPAAGAGPAAAAGSATAAAGCRPAPRRRRRPSRPRPRPRSRRRWPRRRHLSSSSSAARAQRRGGVLVDVVLVDGEDLGGRVALVDVEVAGGFELDGLVVARRCRGHRPRSRCPRRCPSRPVESRQGGGADGSASAAGPASGLGLAAGFGGASCVVEGGQLDRVGRGRGRSRRRLEVDARVAGPAEVDAGGRGLGAGDVRVARAAGGLGGRRRGLELVAARPARSARSRCRSRAGGRR